MNNSGEMWSQPWQALQKNLVEGIRGEILRSSAPFLGVPSVQGLAVSTDSWLSRARRRTAPVQARQ